MGWKHIFTPDKFESFHGTEECANAHPSPVSRTSCPGVSGGQGPSQSGPNCLAGLRSSPRPPLLPPALPSLPQKPGSAWRSVSRGGRQGPCPPFPVCSLRSSHAHGPIHHDLCVRRWPVLCCHCLFPFHGRYKLTLHIYFSSH